MLILCTIESILSVLDTCANGDHSSSPRSVPVSGDADNDNTQE